MSNWIEYWDKDKILVTIVGSFVPRQGDWVKIKLRDKFKLRKVSSITHVIDKTDEFIKEKFQVFLQ